MSDIKEKPRVIHDDDPALFEVKTNTSEKPIPVIARVDYSGAHEKTDPREIALVKKLDRWIMVSSTARPRKSLPQTNRRHIAHAMEHVLAQLP